LRLAEQCKQWDTLPFSGGLLDQPEALMQQLDMALLAKEIWLDERKRQAALKEEMRQHYGEAGQGQGQG
jgi:hypothetical protein